MRGVVRKVLALRERGEGGMPEDATGVRGAACGSQIAHLCRDGQALGVADRSPMTTTVGKGREEGTCARSRPRVCTPTPPVRTQYF